MDEMTAIKDYAQSHGVTIQAVYQQLKRKKNKEALAGHIHKIDGVKYLDKEAVAYLEQQHVNTPAVILQDGKDDRIRLLEEENRRQLQQIAVLQDELLKERNLVKELQEEKIKLLEEKKEPERKGFLARLFGK